MLKIMRQINMPKIEWKCIMTFTFLLSILIYLSIEHNKRTLNKQQNDPINLYSKYSAHLSTEQIIKTKLKTQLNVSINVSSKNNELLKIEFFKERIDKKRRLSVADAKTNFISCITEPTGEDPTGGKKFQKQFIDCLSLHIPIETYDLDSFKAINDEHKRFLPMEKAYHKNAANKCFYLTVGIGNSTEAEKEFLKLYPNCKLFGIEISPYNVGDFSTFGKIINFGIGFNEIVEHLDNYTYLNSQVSHNLTLKPLSLILAEEVGSSLLHYATIDIEGFEYEMMKGFEDSGSYESNGISICQMDIELHNRPIDYKYLPNFFLKASAYLPVYAVPYGEGTKLTVINVKNVYCEEVFRFSKYFER